MLAEVGACGGRGLTPPPMGLEEATKVRFHLTTFVFTFDEHVRPQISSEMSSELKSGITEDLQPTSCFTSSQR